MTSTTRLHILALTSLLCSKLADQILLFAIPVIVFKLTNSFSLSGVAFFVEWVPRIVSLPISGAKLDKVPSQRIYAQANMIRAFVLLLAFMLISFETLGFFLILCVMMAFNGFYYARSFLAEQYFSSHAYDGIKLAKVQAYLLNLEQISQIAGPAIGVGLSMWLNITWELGLIALMFLCSSSMVSLIPKTYFSLPAGTHLKQVRPRHFIKDLSQALEIIFKSEKLKWMIILTVFINLIWGLLLSISAPLVTGTFHLPSGYFGLVQTVAGVMNIVAFMLIPWLIHKWHISVFGLSATLGMIFGVGLIGIGQTYAFFFVGYVLIMVFDGVFNVYIRTERAKLIPKQDLGKTIGMIVFLNQLSVPLAGLLMSVLAMIFSPFSIMLVFCGVTIVALGLAMPRLFAKRELMLSNE